MSLEQKAIAEYTSVVNECSAVGIPNDHIPPYVMDIAVNMYVRGAREQNRIDLEKIRESMLHEMNFGILETPNITELLSRMNAKLQMKE